MRRLILLSLVALAAARYVDKVREKREIEHHEWLTDSQKSELKALKESSDAATLKKRTMELYDLLPADEKAKWNAKYKDMCVAWIKEVATEEETANYKKWKAEGKMEEITSQYNKLKERLTEAKRKDVELWETDCWNLWKDEFPAAASRGRRAIMDLAEDKLAFLGADKIAELKALKESGASDDVIRDKVVTWTLEHWKSKDKNVSTGDFVKKCYAWIKDVTQAEEYTAFEKLHHTDHEACRVKVREFLARLPADKQADVEKSLPLCDAIWYKQHQEEHGAHAGHGDHDHHAHKHHGKRHLNTEHIDKFMTWLSPEQKEEIHNLEKGGESYETLLAKMKEWYLALESDKKTEVRQLLKDKCAEWVYAKTNEEEKAELHDFIRMTDKEGLIEFLKKPYAKLSEEEKHEVDHTKDMCLAIWTHAKDRNRRHDKHEEYKQYFTWLSPEQMAEVKALRDEGKHEESYAKTMEYWAAAAGEKKTAATEGMKGACRHFFKGALGDAAVEELKEMKESGSSIEDISKKVEDLIGKIADQKTKAIASKSAVNCKKVFTAARKRREQADEYAAYNQYFTWLTPEQGAEIKKLKEAKDDDGINTKIHGYYDALEGDKKVEASEKLKGACKHFFGDVFGEAATQELKSLKESGTSMDDIANKVSELIGKIDDEKKKAVATRAAANCKKIFSASRRRRDHHGDHHEEYKEYFNWLTPEQGAEIKALRDAEKHDDAYAKTWEFYEAIAADKKPEIEGKLKGACKHFFSKAFGAEAVEEVKQMKESGSSMDDIGKKVEEFIAKITDEKKKAVANRVSVNCKKVFSASRKRRSDPSEEYKEYFSWLTPEQGAEWKAARDAGDEEGAYKKVEAIYDALEGDKKTEATEKLKGACKHFFNKEFGAAQVEEFKKLKESGASLDEINTKVAELIGKITDDKKKAKATRIAGNCKKVFGASRKRRSDKYEEYKQYFTWLSPEQAAEVKALREAGKHQEAYEKTLEFHSALDGEKKVEATEKMKGACKHYFKEAFGEAAVEEVKAMKDSGSSMDEIGNKVEEFIGKITDEQKKAVANRVSINCKKIFGASRRRRHQKHSIDEHIDMFLPWLSDEQKAEIKAQKESGSEKIGDKILEFFENVDASKKEEARTKLKAGCKHFLGHLIGETAAAEMKALKETGATDAEMAAQLEKVIGAMADGADKTKAEKMSKNCKKVYGVASRKRRHQHTLEEGFTEFLPWLTDAQKAELKALKESGGEDKLGEKVLEFYESVDASKKEEATTKLQAGCKHYIKHLIGDAPAAEMKALSDAGTSAADLSAKLAAIIGAMPDGADKAKAERLAKNCKKVFGVASRKRRHEHTLEEGFTEFLPWLTEEQKMELKNMKEAGAHDKMGEKILEYYETVDASKKDEARKKLQAGCRHYISSLIGDAASAEMKALHEAGSTPADMSTKLDEIIGKMADGADKTKAERMSKNCKKVYGVASRKRRHEHTLEEGLSEFLPWITEEQKMEIKNMKEAGAGNKIGDKVMEYYENVDASKKDEARTKLQGACRHYIKHLLGDEVAGEIKQMAESGSPPTELAKKLDEIISEMEDGEKRTKAAALSKNCRKVYGVESRKRRNLYGEYDERYHQYYNWLDEDQREELTELKDSGDDDDALLDKVSLYFKELSDAKKEEARGQLKMGCRMRMRDLLGEDKAEEIKRMKDEGASKGEMMDKVAAFVEEMEEGDEKESARRSYKHCAKILGRQRRENKPPGNLGDYTRWLTAEQRQELNAIIRSDTISSDDIYSKLFEFLDSLEGKEKMDATMQMKGACRLFRAQFLGEDQSKKLTMMRESGKRWTDIEHTMDGMIAAIEDESKRRKAQAAMNACKVLYKDKY